MWAILKDFSGRANTGNYLSEIKLIYSSIKQIGNSFRKGYLLYHTN
jgi:hypothetical protein